jgi:hypothetical protein
MFSGRGDALVAVAQLIGDLFQNRSQPHWHSDVVDCDGDHITVVLVVAKPTIQPLQPGRPRAAARSTG